MTPVTLPVVVGLDLSLSSTGLAGPMGTQCIRTQPSDALPERLLLIRETLLGVVDSWLADLVVIEDLPPAHKGHAGNLLGMVHGVVRVALHEAGHQALTVAPATLKKYLTGKGNAPKGDVRMAIYKRFGVDLRDDNEADAFGLRAIGLDLLGHPLVKMPAVNVAALEKLPRPVLRGVA